ncbi:MAG: sulfide dehydrogenase [Chlorobiaceae bacterium]|nr:sulfide dehydrogenase [Chlorobiaceae bacterium]
MPSMLKMLLTAGLVASMSVAVAAKGFASAKAKAGGVAKVDPRGQVLSLSCSGCHGPDGKSSGVIPSFNGKSPEYIEAALKEFKSGERVSTVMGRHAKGYTDGEIHLIAEYLGTVGKKTK